MRSVGLDITGAGEGIRNFPNKLAITDINKLIYFFSAYYSAIAPLLKVGALNKIP